MSFRAGFLLLALAAPLAAQTPSDSLEETVYDVTFPDVNPVLALAGYVAYRIEVRPAASVVIRSRSNRIPLTLETPPTDALESSGGRTWFVLPPRTAEYEVLAPNGVRVRIVRDPRETARWTRVTAATANMPRAGVSVRAAYLAKVAPRRGSLTPSDSSDAGGAGFDVCFGVVPRGGWIDGPLAGCALQVGYFHRGSHGDVLTFSLAPRLLLTPAEARTRVSIQVSAGLATAVRTRQEQNWWIFTGGVGVEHPLFGWVVLDAEASLAHLRLSTDYGSQPNSSVTTPRLALGLQWRL